MFLQQEVQFYSAYRTENQTVQLKKYITIEYSTVTEFNAVQLVLLIILNCFENF